MDSEIPKGIYQHFKGNLYEVLGTARHSETEEIYVVYCTLYGEQSSWIRPLAMFEESVMHNGISQSRFKLIKASTPDSDLSTDD